MCFLFKNKVVRFCSIVLRTPNRLFSDTLISFDRVRPLFIKPLCLDVAPAAAMLFCFGVTGLKAAGAERR